MNRTIATAPARGSEIHAGIDDASELKQRVRDAMEGADRKTAHLLPCSEEYVKLWMKAFHDAL